ncbi:hypothetical protein LK996_01165 [Lysobacter sp. A6]|uniref:DUF983 domain-containing protein n=1 Tax=Noviluteimonas lactosilytica TaxID=2888523 RepID=A0ABS8JDL4_9GAMM|nr:hypothetical protein [Lysobacter lactosilyticus]MCC8361694.1 hypothetical protein [Lysobacter lactosilyticus]
MSKSTFFQRLVSCPHCGDRIAIEDSRTYVPIPEKSTPNRQVQWMYTVCPRCRHDYIVIGEQRAAWIALGAFFASVASTFFIPSWWTLIVVGAVLLLQNKIMQLFVRAVRA